MGIGADCCANASVWVDSADPWGILITNGEFTSFSGSFGPDVADHTQVVVTASNSGSVRFTNSAFWGPSNQIVSARLRGPVLAAPVTVRPVPACLACVPTPLPSLALLQAKLNGTGTVAFDSCIFNYWDADNQNRSAIQVYGGNAQVRGNDFQHKGGQLLVTGSAKKVTAGTGAPVWCGHAAAVR